MSQQPSVGRVVHYTTRGWGFDENGPRSDVGKVLAAVITDVYDHGEGDCPNVDLHILYPRTVGEEFLTEEIIKQGYPYSETPRIGHWNWPPRV